MASIHAFVDVCSQLSSLSYRVESSDEEIRIKVQEINPAFQVFHFERSPIGSLAVFDTVENRLFVSYRGTDSNISQYLIDGAIALLGDEPKRMGDFSSAMASLHRFGSIAGAAFSLLRSNGGEEAGKELLQSFTFRAVMFAKRAIELTETSNIVITGHSLGGMYAQIVSEALGCDVLTFGAPGAKRFYEIATKEIAFYLSPIPSKEVKALHIASVEDLIGTFGYHTGEHLIIPYVPLNGVPQYLKSLKSNGKSHAQSFLEKKRSQTKAKVIDEAALQQAKETLRQSRTNQNAFTRVLSLMTSSAEQNEVDRIQDYLTVQSFCHQLNVTPIDFEAMHRLFSDNEKAISLVGKIPTASTLMHEANLAKLRDAHSIAGTLASYYALKEDAPNSSRLRTMRLDDDTLPSAPPL